MTRFSQKYAKQIRRQSYKKESIAGVRLVDLRRFVDDGGDFEELVRMRKGLVEGLPGFEVLQVNHSVVHPGAIKGWHLHENQDDVWFVPSDERLLVGLLDLREGSATEGVSQRLVLGDGQARLLHIPRGVAHGMANVSRRPTHVLYLVNQQFDPERPDELRLPADLLGDNFWSIRPG